MGFLYLDEYYLLLCVPALFLSLIAQWKVKSSYSKYSQVRNIRGITGAEAAKRVLAFYGVSDVRIERTSGRLSDHFDPSANVIRLSSGVFDGISIAAVGIACHEAGHAAQHAEGYLPIKIRQAVIPITRFGSTAGIFLALFGYIFGFEPLVSIGLLLYFFIVVFQLVTLPVEFNASRRAISVINETNMLTADELPQAKKMLSAAAMTYVAALIVSFAQFLRILLRFSNKNRRR
ncbi:MAG: zinc metallopeptidase [Acutalibacteraceae bacterium]